MTQALLTAVLFPLKRISPVQQLITAAIYAVLAYAVQAGWL
jgi:hypothetical protein